MDMLVWRWRAQHEVGWSAKRGDVVRARQHNFLHSGIARFFFFFCVCVCVCVAVCWCYHKRQR
jgi:hypothetical protein